MNNGFDPIAYERELERTGVPHEQALVHARALDAVASTCVTIDELDKVEARLRAEVHTAAHAGSCKSDDLKGDLGDWRDRVDDLGAQIAEFKAETKVKFATVQAAIASFEPRSASVETRLDSLESKLTSVEARLTSVEIRLENIELRLSALEEKITSLEHRITRVENKQKLHDRLFAIMIAMQTAIIIKQYFP